MVVLPLVNVALDNRATPSLQQDCFAINLEIRRFDPENDMHTVIHIGDLATPTILILLFTLACVAGW